MQIWRAFDDVPADLGRTVVTIGNFDGVHLGHRHVLAQARETADELNVDTVVVVTFDPHPMAVLRPEHAPPVLTSIETRARLLAETGVDAVLVLPFDRGIADWTPEEFIDRTLVGTLHARAVVVGANFRFGHRAAGDVALLREVGAERGFVVEGIDLDGGPQVWSSTYVRQCLASGDVSGAAQALGRAFTVRGVVVEGDQRGRELGYPTANVPTPVEGAAPADGVYAGWLTRRDTGERLPAAISVGTNPTFDGERERRVESHVLDRHDLELYGVEVDVEFVERLRGMVRFEGVEALVETMHEDVRRTREILGTARVTQRRDTGDPVADTEAWFLEHGLSYFVPSERAAARDALTRRRLLPALAVVVVVAALLAGLLGWLSRQVAAAPAVLLTVVGGAALAYALTALRARPIVGWALKRTLSSLGSVLSTASRALPLLLVFVAFLFINAEAWQMASSLGFGTLWLTALLLLGLGAVFLLVRLPEEVDQADDAVDDAFLVRACAGTPLEGVCRELLDDPEADPAAHAHVTGYDRWNLIVVLLVIQAVQVLVLVAAVFGFLLVFGSLIVNESVQESWTGQDFTTHVPFLATVSAELVKVSLFLASFSGLYFTVSAITDETYRGQFFAAVMVHLEKAVGVRAVYLALREREARRRL